MTLKAARHKGGMLGLKSAGIGITTAYLMMAFIFAHEYNGLGSLLWISSVNYKFNLISGGIILLCCGYFFGQLASKMILVKKWNAMLCGMLCGVCVLVSAAFLSGWPGFFQEGIHLLGTGDDPFTDYILKPFYWITLYGMIPAILTGVWLGWRIRKNIAGLKSHDLNFPQ